MAKPAGGGSPGPRQPSPITATKVLELEHHGAFGPSRLLADVSMTTDRYLAIIRRSDGWTQPTLSVLDLKNPKNPVFISSIIFDLECPCANRLAQCKISPDARWVLFYDSRKTWLLSLRSEHHVTARPVDLHTGTANLHLIVAKWTACDRVTVVTVNSLVFELEIRTNPAGDWFISPSSLKPILLPYPTGKMVNFSAAGRWSASTSVQFEKGQPVGTLQICSGGKSSDSGLVSLPNQTAATFAKLLNSKTKEMESVLIYAGPGADPPGSLSILAIRCRDEEGDVSVASAVSTPKWRLNFRHAGSVADVKAAERDLPVALHVLQDTGLVFLVTKASFVHVFQLENGNHVGTQRVSQSTSFLSVPFRDQLGILLLDSNGTICRVSLDVDGWISQLGLVSSSVEVRRPFLRFVLQHDIPLQDALFFKLFPDIVPSNVKANEEAMELIAPLDGKELIKLFANALRNGSAALVPTIRMLAAKNHAKATLVELIKLFRAHGAAAGVFNFLSVVGVSDLTGKFLVEYIEAAIITEKWSALGHALLKLKVANPEEVRIVLSQKKAFCPDIATLFEKFCERFDFVEDLTGHYVGKGLEHVAALKQLIEKSDAGRVQRVVKVLLEHDIPEGLLDALLTLVKPTALTPDFVALFRQHKRLVTGFKYFQFLLGKADADAGLVTLLAGMVQGAEAELNRDIKVKEFYRNLGKARCLEIGRALQKVGSQGHQLALLIYQCAGCNTEYIKLATEQRLSDELAGFLLVQADKVLWESMLADTNPNQEMLHDAFYATSFRAEVLSCSFDALKALLTVLEGQYATWTLLILGYLKDKIFPEKRERGFLQECNLTALVELYPKNHSKICDYIAEHKDFNHVKILLDLLEKKMTDPAHVVMARLVDKEVVEEITEKDLNSLGRLARASDEKDVWNLIGSVELNRGNVGAALCAYTHGHHYANHTSLLKIVKAKSDFEEWDDVVAYLEMVQSFVKDGVIHAALAFALSKANRYEEMEKLFESRSEVVEKKAVASDAQNCRICEDAPMEMNFLPCNHICACTTCADSLKLCPMCRGPITGRHRVYLS